MRSTAYIKLVGIAVIAGVIVYFVVRFILGLPTAEEKVLVNAMKEFKRGRYDALSQLCIDKSFYKVVNNSDIFDTDGSKIDWKKFSYTVNEANLRDTVEIYVRFHLRKFEFKSLDTQRLEEGKNAVVKFYADVLVADSTGGEILAPPLREGSLEGKCFVTRDTHGEIVIEKFEIILLSVEGLSLTEYLQM
jgi:hypothetical protein